MGKTVLITGASRGIGAATAREFVRQGWQVALNYCASAHRAGELARTLGEEGGTVALFQADVSDPAAARRLVQGAEKEFGQLDALVCNAGVSRFGLLTDVTDEDWRQVMSVNLDGVFYTMRSAIPGMVRRKQGAIVTVSSMWGVTGGSCEGAYSAAKAGVIGLTRAAAKELGPSNIRVNCVAPGVIDTEMNAGLSQEALLELAQDTPLGRTGTAQEVAQTIFFLCCQQSSFLTGQVLQPNGGLVI